MIILARAIHQFISTKNFQEHINITKIIPLNKQNYTDIIDNCRPIAVLPVLSQLLKKLFLFKYAIANYLLYKGLFWFRNLHFTELASAEIINKS